MKRLDVNLSAEEGRSSMSEPIKIIRSAVGSMPSWGLIQELQNLGVKIIGIDSNPLSFGLYKLDERYVVPKGNEAGFIPAMLDIVSKTKANAILSGPEEELEALSRHKKEFEARGAKVLCPDHEYVVRCNDKLKSIEEVNQLDIPIPRVYEDMDSVQFPCIIKPRFGRGSSNIFIARNEDEYTLFIKKVPNPIVQEYILGEEYTVDILADQDGNALSVVPRIRLNVESGISVKAKTVHDEILIEMCKKIARRFKLFGPSCVQFMKREDEYFFLEINPRFGGGSILSIKADPSILSNLLRLIKDEDPIPSTGFKQNLIMLRYYSEVYLTEKELLPR